MLDRDGISQRSHYEPGCGTYLSSNLLARNPSRVRAWWLEAKDALIGSSYAQHVMSAYRFLMRNHSPEDSVYIFGFSRGAFVARLVAEMLDHIGLLEAGNEEMIRLVWKTFAQWKRRSAKTDTDSGRKQEQYSFMKAFRETFCRPMSQINFLGLFDVVNSIPGIEMLRSKLQFPYARRTSVKVVRHAVSIDERRARFRNEIMSDTRPRARSRKSLLHRQLRQHRPHINHENGCSFSWRSNGDGSEFEGGARHAASRESDSPDTLYRIAETSRRHGSRTNDRPCGAGLHDEGKDVIQDIEEVWFPGTHPDIGGGMKLGENEDWPLSHVPLVWIVQEAQRAGLKFDLDKLVQFNCIDASTLQAQDDPEECTASQRENERGQDGEEVDESAQFKYALRRASTHGQLHDSLRYRQGIPWREVSTWRILEYLPFQRMELQQGKAWKPIRCPLPRGEVRCIPKEARIHASAIRRMEADSKYRPKNLIEGERGKGKKLPPWHGFGEWEIASDRGCPVRETYRRKQTSKESS